MRRADRVAASMASPRKMARDDAAPPMVADRPSCRRAGGRGEVQALPGPRCSRQGCAERIVCDGDDQKPRVATRSRTSHHRSSKRSSRRRASAATSSTGHASTSTRCRDRHGADGPRGARRVREDHRDQDLVRGTRRGADVGHRGLRATTTPTTSGRTSRQPSIGYTQAPSARCWSVWSAGGPIEPAVDELMSASSGGPRSQRSWSWTTSTR